jgi:hypothetical protein
MDLGILSSSDYLFLRCRFVWIGQVGLYRWLWCLLCLGGGARWWSWDFFSRDLCDAELIYPKSLYSFFSDKKLTVVMFPCQISFFSSNFTAQCKGVCRFPSLTWIPIPLLRSSFMIPWKPKWLATWRMVGRVRVRRVFMKSAPFLAKPVWCAHVHLR